jgi:hypothetical protein
VRSRKPSLPLFTRQVPESLFLGYVLVRNCSVQRLKRVMNVGIDSHGFAVPLDHLEDRIDLARPRYTEDGRIDGAAGSERSSGCGGSAGEQGAA